MIPSALEQAAGDPRITDATYRVYFWCTRNLDTVEERPVKVAAVARELRKKEVTIFRALRLLAESGYIARGHRPRRGVRHYRLYASPVKAKAA